MIGIIGGTGLCQMAELAAPRAQEMTTPFGPPSAPPLLGTLRGRAVAFLARHGLRHEYLPGEINFRANIWALEEPGGAHRDRGVRGGQPARRAAPG